MSDSAVNTISPAAMGYPEGAAYISTSESTLRRLIDAGKIPSVRINRRVVILRADLDAFLAEHRNPRGRS